MKEKGSESANCSLRDGKIGKDAAAVNQRVHYTLRPAQGEIICFSVSTLESFIKPSVKVAFPLRDDAAAAHSARRWPPLGNKQQQQRDEKKKRKNHAALRRWRPADWPTAGNPSRLRGEGLEGTTLKVSGGT